MKSSTRELVECAVMLAIATVLSLFTVAAPWALGGGVTFCSMLPLVIISHRYGCFKGFIAATLFGAIQMFLGMANVTFAIGVQDSVLMGLGVILLDYLLAYGVIGLASMFNGIIEYRLKSVIAGIAFTFFLRFVCHFTSGVVIWEAIAKNAKGWSAPVWSLAYNAAFMITEAIITMTVAALTYSRLKAYWTNEQRH